MSQLEEGLAAVKRWQGQWAEIPQHPSLQLDPQEAGAALAALAERLQDNYPFHHPSYAGQMLKPPHQLAHAAYAMAMLINPNNHALDGGPASAAMEREAVALMAAMVGYEEHLGHLTSSGTIANLEALWVARQLHPGKAIAYSTQAHYTHPRMCEVLGVKGVPIAVDAQGRMDLADLDAKLATGEIGTVVVTLGTTGLGALDPLHEIVKRDVRVHVDSAYGGFFRLLAELEPPMVEAAPYLAMAEADSIVIDPHKHGLQPYGCGTVLFKDPSVGRLYKHDSPYTYFTSKELHLGEISLECSRAGAAAAALWTTLRCFPLSASLGLGPVLQATRRAGLAWAALLEASPYAHLVMQPELDIVGFFPLGGGWTASGISAETDRVFEALMAHPQEPVYLAKVNLPRALVEPRAPKVQWDQDTVTCLRSVLMKPEHEALVPYLHARFEHEAWWPDAELPPPPAPRGKALTGPLNVKAEWANLVSRYHEKVRAVLVNDLRQILVAKYHPGVGRLHFELTPPYGLGGACGLRLVTQSPDGEAFKQVGGEANGFSGVLPLLADQAPLIPGEVRGYERFAPLVDAEESLEDLAGKHLLEFFLVCWEAAGGDRCTYPATIGFEGEEEVLDLKTGRWEDVPGRP
jgi:glutamate/tyrosine decarboxylase-like PLP-dependent enzyme